MKPSTEQSGQNKVEDLPPFGAPVLEPGLDLRLAELQGLGQFHAFGRRQVALLLEATFQAVQLVVGEHGARLAPSALLRSDVGLQQSR